jgi:3-oxo-5-alpha-steroid 4-dehydrogenase 1
MVSEYSATIVESLMVSVSSYFIILVAWIFLAFVAFVVLLVIPAPYGRFTRAGWGPTLPSSLNWMLMESPTILVFDGLFLISSERTATHWCFFLLWNLHYLYRSLVFPCLIHTARRVPLTIMLCGVGFNVINGWIQAVWLFHLAAPVDSSWLRSPTFLMGALFFLGGFIIHVQADSHLRNLRKAKGSGYHIPSSGLFRWISSPNYFGELLEWTGWAILTWSWSGVAFVIWTAANLIPRALAIHRWYHAQFPDYPKQRNAIFPFRFSFFRFNNK